MCKHSNPGINLTNFENKFKLKNKNKRSLILMHTHPHTLADIAYFADKDKKYSPVPDQNNSTLGQQNNENLKQHCCILYKMNVFIYTLYLMVLSIKL